MLYDAYDFSTYLLSPAFLNQLGFLALWGFGGFGVGWVIVRVWRSFLMSLGILFLIFIITGYYDTQAVNWNNIQMNTRPLLLPLAMGVEHFVADIAAGLVFLVGIGFGLRYKGGEKTTNKRSTR